MERCPQCFKTWGDGKPSPAVPDTDYWVLCPSCENILDKHLELFDSLARSLTPGEMELTGGPHDGRRVAERPTYRRMGFTDDGTPIVDTYEKLPGKQRAIYIGRARADQAEENG